VEIFNTLTRQIEHFEPVNPEVVAIFTCGPSIYQRAHIGNFRTFLFEDILVRYLEYKGYTVHRGMNFTDIEDKAIREALSRRITVHELTDCNIRDFLEEMNTLRMKIPDYLPRASEHVESAAALIAKLLERGVAYRHKENIYFDPLRYPNFGELYGLDMSRWPRKKRRYHKDTYPGMRWNRGDFVLWHGCAEASEVCWDTRIGEGRPAWNIQDPSMISAHFDETLSVYCGGIDNLIRHHDYNRAVLESVRPYPMARYWMHCQHLYVDGKKMSKSVGNILYTDSLTERGYDVAEIRFFLLYGHYRTRLNYTDQKMEAAAEKLAILKNHIASIQEAAGDNDVSSHQWAARIEEAFALHMENDLDVKGAVDAVESLLSVARVSNLTTATGRAILDALRAVDSVLQVLF